MTEEKKFEEQVAPLTISQADLFRLLVRKHFGHRICNYALADISLDALYEVLCGQNSELAKAALRELSRRLPDCRSAAETLIRFARQTKVYNNRAEAVLALGLHGNPQDEDIIMPLLLELISNPSESHFQEMALSALTQYEYLEIGPQVVGTVLDHMFSISRYGKADDHIDKFFGKIHDDLLAQLAAIGLLTKLNLALKGKEKRDVEMCLRGLTDFTGGRFTEHMALRLFNLLQHERGDLYLCLSRYFAEFVKALAKTKAADQASLQLVEYVRCNLDRVSKEVVWMLLPYMNLSDGQAARRVFVDWLNANSQKVHSSSASMLRKLLDHYQHLQTDEYLFAYLEEQTPNGFGGNQDLAYAAYAILPRYHGTEFAERAAAALELTAKNKPRSGARLALKQLKNPPGVDDHIKSTLQCVASEWGLATKRIEALKTLWGNSDWFEGRQAAKIVQALTAALLNRDHFSIEEWDAGLVRNQYLLTCQLLTRFVGTKHESAAAQALVKGQTKIINYGVIEAMAAFKGEPTTLKCLLNLLSASDCGHSEIAERAAKALEQRQADIEALEVE